MPGSGAQGCHCHANALWPISLGRLLDGENLAWLSASLDWTPGAGGLESGR